MSATKEYQERLASILQELDLDLDPDIVIEVKPFFGGAAGYANGRICLSLTKVGFAVKLPQAERKELLDMGAQPLRYFPKAPVKKEYVILPDIVVDDPVELQKWAAKCIHLAVNKNA